LEFLDRISKEAPNINFHVIPSSTIRTDTWGQTDRHTDRQTEDYDEGNRRYSRQWKRASQFPAKFKGHLPNYM